MEKTGKLEDRKSRAGKREFSCPPIFLSLILSLVWLRPKAAPGSSVLCVVRKSAIQLWVPGTGPRQVSMLGSTGVTMPRIEVNGVNLHYQQSGQGRDVVLVHAFTSNLSVWMLIGRRATCSPNEVGSMCADDQQGGGVRGHVASIRSPPGLSTILLTPAFVPRIAVRLTIQNWRTARDATGRPGAHPTEDSQPDPDPTAA
jgi:hypothetical protein